MILPKNVKLLPFYLRFIRYRGLSFYPWIFLRKDIYKDLLSESPSNLSIATLIHEQTHIKRMKKIGLTRFAIKYWIDKDFRFQEELAAVKESMEYLKKRGEVFNIEKTAKALSSYQYLWCTSYQKALQELNKVWTKA